MSQSSRSLPCLHYGLVVGCALQLRFDNNKRDCVISTVQYLLGLIVSGAPHQLSEFIDKFAGSQISTIFRCSFQCFGMSPWDYRCLAASSNFIKQVLLGVICLTLYALHLLDCRPVTFCVCRKSHRSSTREKSLSPGRGEISQQVRKGSSILCYWVVNAIQHYTTNCHHPLGGGNLWRAYSFTLYAQ